MPRIGLGLCLVDGLLHEERPTDISRGKVSTLVRYERHEVGRIHHAAETQVQGRGCFGELDGCCLSPRDEEPLVVVKKLA